MNESKLLTTGQRQVERGQFRAAADTYAKLLVEEPDNVQALLFLADVYHRLEDEEAAVEAFSRASQTYARQGDALKALTVQRQAVELLPDSPEAYGTLGHLCMEQDRGEEAMEAFSRAMDCYQTRGDRLGALRLVHGILRVVPDHLSGWLRVAEGLSALGHVKEASEALRVLASKLHEMKRDGEFRLVAERLLYHDASDGAVARRLAQSYLAEGLIEEALPALRVACRAAPRDLELLGILRDALVKLGHEDNAVVVLKGMARIYDSAGHLTERDACYDQILELTPDDESVRQAMDPPRTLAETPTIVLEHEPPVVRPPVLKPSEEVPSAPAELGFGDPVTAQVVAVEMEGERAPITAQVLSVEQVGVHAPVTSQMVSAQVWGDAEAVVDAPGVSEAAGPLTAPVIQVQELGAVSPEVGGVLNEGSLDRILQEGANPVSSPATDLDDLVASAASAEGGRSDMDALFAVTHAVLDHQVSPETGSSPSRETEEEVHELLARELEELDFYIAQGLDDEAGVLVAELKERYGEHPAVRRRTMLMNDSGRR